jgi:hypothetical protein
MSAPADDAREHDRRIERLLAEAEAATGPVAWPRVEALLTALVDLYGRGLEQVLAHARAVLGEASSSLDDCLEEDELVASLLVLHGLHPLPVEQRVGKALASVRRELPDATPVTLVSIDGDTATLRSDGAHPPAAQLIARTVEREAPELEGIRIVTEGSSPGLVPATRLHRKRTA